MSADLARKKDLARIHILKAALALDRDTYEAVLWAQGRVESSAQLDAHGRQQVIDHLQQLLTRLNPKHPALGKYQKRPHNTDVAKRKEMAKIEALLTDAGLPWSYAQAMAQRMYGRSRIEFCHSGQLAGIVAALHNAALKRLHGEFEKLWGEGWQDTAKLETHAALLFGFDVQHQNASRYPEIMSRVLRWLRGELASSVCVMHSGFPRALFSPEEVAALPTEALLPW
jgi:phage gp16-like protein